MYINLLEFTQEGLDNLFMFIKKFIVVAIILLLVIIALYIATAIFMSKFNKLTKGKGTIKAYLPLFRTYLLGRLTFGPVFGWILLIIHLLNPANTTTIMGKTISTSQYFSPKVSNIISLAYWVVVIILYIYAIIKYKKLKKVRLQPKEQERTADVNDIYQRAPIEEKIVEDDDASTNSLATGEDLPSIDSIINYANIIEVEKPSEIEDVEVLESPFVTEPKEPGTEVESEASTEALVVQNTQTVQEEQVSANQNQVQPLPASPIPGTVPVNQLPPEQVITEEVVDNQNANV